MSEAKEIAELIYPIDWKVSGDFKIDNNAGRRHCAEKVAEHFLEVLSRDSTARAVMLAFFRRENRREPTEDEALHLQCHMSTALLNVVFALKSQPNEVNSL